jgi:mono/diheme cytochrome c family protein
MGGIVLLVTLLERTVAQPPVARAGSSVWDGVYSAAQAERGKSAYSRHCGRCHGEDLANPSNPLTGDRFAEHWESRTLADLFRRIRDTMPAGDVTSVDERDKLDTLAYVLQQNGFPEGRTELAPNGESLAATQITGRNGPAPARTGTLVRAVGCLERGVDREWQLTSASDPQRVTSLDTTSDPRHDAASPVAPGTRTIVLLNPFPSPAEHERHRVAATGFLVRRADGDAVNVVSLAMIAPTCSP